MASDFTLTIGGDTLPAHPPGSRFSRIGPARRVDPENPVNALFSVDI